MNIKKSFPFLIVIILTLMSLLFSGCYTQLSRPHVDSEYYPDKDEEYLSDDDQDVKVNYYDVYIYSGMPFYYGPHVWVKWSPYYRYYRWDRFDPWWSAGYFDYWGYGIYDPFWDPWYDYWWYHNYYFYHPRHRYYWSYDDGYGRWQPKKEMRQRDFDRRGLPIEKDRLRSRRLASPEETPEQIKKQTGADEDRIISRQERPADPVVVKKRPTEDQGTPTEVRRSKRVEDPEVISKPKEKDHTPAQKSSPKTESPQKVKRAEPPKKSDSSSYQRPERSRSSESSPPPASKNSGSEKKSNNPKSSDSSKKKD